MQKPRFKEGDCLTIKKHTEEEKRNYPNGWNPNMDKKENTTVIIKKVLGSFRRSKEAYMIHDDADKQYIWDVSSLIVEYNTF